MLPKDPVMLMSVLNTKLRDQYDSLEALCDDLELNRDELTIRLQEAGFDYDPEAIGKHMLETLAKFQTEGYYSRPFHRHG